MKCRVSTVLLCAALVASGPAASAQSLFEGRTFGFYDGRGYPYVPEGPIPGLVRADGSAYVKQCPNDDEPCDPPAYKRDGRCDGLR